MKLWLIGLGLCLSSHTFAFTLSPVYKNGQEVCEENAAQRTEEIFRYTSVPADYKNPEGEKTYIYSYLKKPYDPNLPSVIFFTGGPGVSSRSSEFSLLHYNLIFIEQRGISCSRPPSEKLFLDPNFYSTMNTARDAWHVIKSYGVSKVSVYGHSYGTVAATVFASTYHEVTQSLVLEGVVFKADESLWRDSEKLSLLQSFFDHLPAEMKKKILHYSQSGAVSANWFSKVGNMMMYLNGGLDSYFLFLEQALSMEEDSFNLLISNFYSAADKAEETFSFGDVTMGMIGCKEMSMAKPGLSMTSVFSGDKLISDNQNEELINYCHPLNLTHNENTTYKAQDFPLKVPVFYLLGEHDGATSLAQGLKHYDHVAQSKKQAMILKKGGHLPMLDLLKNNRSCDSIEDCERLKQNQVGVSLFEKMLSGQEVSSTELHYFNQSGELQWKIH